jgi:hypothetical protein
MEDDVIMGLDEVAEATKGQSTVVGIVLDRSGSMSSTWKEAIGGYHAQVEDLCKQDDADEDTEIKLVSVVFDNIIDVINKGVPITEAEGLGPEIIPRGSTALYDAIGVAVGHMESTQTEHSDTAYLLVVITDGQENASQEITAENLMETLNRLDDSPVWTVVFIGSDVKAIEDAKNLGINLGNAFQYNPTAGGTAGMTVSLRSATSTYMANRTSGRTKSTTFAQDMTTSGDKVEESESNSAQSNP